MVLAPGSILLFPEKEAKSVSSASQKAQTSIGEADPWGRALSETLR
jgi:hypothetical protein